MPSSLEVISGTQHSLRSTVNVFVPGADRASGHSLILRESKDKLKPGETPAMRRAAELAAASAEKQLGRRISRSSPIFATTDQSAKGRWKRSGNAMLAGARLVKGIEDEIDRADQEQAARSTRIEEALVGESGLGDGGHAADCAEDTSTERSGTRDELQRLISQNYLLLEMMTRMRKVRHYRCHHRHSLHGRSQLGWREGSRMNTALSRQPSCEHSCLQTRAL